MATLKGFEPSTPGVTGRYSNHLSYSVVWWAEQDLNLRSRRRQIYSLIPLTTRESTHTTAITSVYYYT